MPTPGLDAFPAAAADEAADGGGIVVIVKPARLPRRLPPRERELRREYAAGVDAPERDLRDEEAPDLVRWWWRVGWGVVALSRDMSTRLVELSRLESQL